MPYIGYIIQDRISTRVPKKEERILFIIDSKSSIADKYTALISKARAKKYPNDISIINFV